MHPVLILIPALGLILGPRLWVNRVLKQYDEEDDRPDSAHEIAREMLVTGDWVVPRLKGEPHWSKPPLTYWLVAASIAVFGYHEPAARLPSAIAAIVAAFTVFDLGRRMAGRF